MGGREKERVRKREKERRRREKKRTTKLIAVFAVNGNGDHLLAVSSHLSTLGFVSSISDRTLMRHNADRMIIISSLLTGHSRDTQ